LQGLNILDVGCGGGLVCELLARLGARVTGWDGDLKAIEIATDHAKSQELCIHYACQMAGEHPPSDHESYDVVLALEIIEHLDNPAGFVTSLHSLVRPNGLVILSTLNKTLKSLVLGIGAAEYLLNWVPRGTHDWNKFLKPSQLAAHCTAADLRITDIQGLSYAPLSSEFILSSDVSVNYFLTATK
jgi:2-polyprenyl-6-hydroxyphenyl methylase/3-demethylubiquinone-9 3-methyltransferase